MNAGCQIFRKILQATNGGKGIKFRQKAVRYYWARLGCDIWQLDDDPIESAREYCRKHGPKENIEEVEMDHVPGSRAFAFVVKDFMDGWARNTSTFLVDSTCK
jgi:hypothetical protein